MICLQSWLFNDEKIGVLSPNRQANGEPKALRAQAMPDTGRFVDPDQSIRRNVCL
jgi:hypothetical protein